MKIRPYHWKAFLIVGVCASAGFAYYKYFYPFGRSHCCDKVLYFELVRFAHANGGRFPAGESSPEASLSLLYRFNPDIAPTLRGKTVPETVVITRLRSGKLLTPKTCGWRYVEGLSMKDDPLLAVFWDKAGLGHNGERLSGGGHIVWFVDGERRHIKQAEWADFETDQKQRLITHTKQQN